MKPHPYLLKQFKTLTLEYKPTERKQQALGAAIEEVDHNASMTIRETRRHKSKRESKECKSLYVCRNKVSVCLSVCMFCMRVCMYVCMYVCVRACMRACMNVCACVHACMHVCACVRACVRVCVCVLLAKSITFTIFYKVENYQPHARMSFTVAHMYQSGCKVPILLLRTEM